MRIRIFIGIMAYHNGAVAQLGERLPCTEEVRSSSLLSSTIEVIVLPCNFVELPTGKRRGCVCVRLA